jgi:hypothetical protein
VLALNATKPAPAVMGNRLQNFDQLGGTIEAPSNTIPQELPSGRTDWNALVPLWWVGSMPCRHCGMAPCDDPIPSAARPSPMLKPKPQPTPQSTIEAVVYSVRQHGLSALKSAHNRERLSRCDTRAKAEINQRIAKSGGVT